MHYQSTPTPPPPPPLPPKKSNSTLFCFFEPIPEDYEKETESGETVASCSPGYETSLAKLHFY